MKKFAKIAAFVLVVAMSLALLVACAPNSDPDKAVAALKDNGYKNATLTDDSNFLSSGALGVAETLLGCKRGDLKAVVSGSMTDDNGNRQSITIWYFKDSSTASSFWDKAQTEANKDEDKDEKDWTVAKSGAMIYFGTSAAIKAAR